MPKVLAIANQKGGVGKTTTALSLGCGLSILGKKVLVLDLDAHACGTVHLGFFPGTYKTSALDIFLPNSEKQQDSLIYKKETLRFDFVPAHIKLAEVEGNLKGSPGRGWLLKKWLLRYAKDYDFVVLDCPPHTGVILLNALAAADLVIVPVQTDFLALHGLKLIFDTFRLLKIALKRNVNFKILATMYDIRTKASRRVFNLLRKKLGDKLFSTVISIDTNFREASSEGKTIFEYAPKSRGAFQYLQLAKEILRQ
ncbi:chromosome partitioning protein [Desulfonauticus submarinus]|uniref:Chromosome partitioning protein n=1 Tax=Desulfonauticus submarinus TaxID=206665 RepID=A0A1H0CS46_9BACT|nr:ParA family protein [Desulfonauticus submarinus]SDN60615.1 chromosome partitioning protein [Desulfonauticus submarinus]